MAIYGLRCYSITRKNYTIALSLALTRSLSLSLVLANHLSFSPSPSLESPMILATIMPPPSELIFQMIISERAKEEGKRERDE